MKGTILILTALFLVSCSKQAADLGKPIAFVSIPPQAGLLKALVGDSMDVRTLVGEGQSPHAYEPTARQLAALGQADVLFTVGVPFEKSLLKKVVPLYPALPIVGTDASIIKRTMPHAHHEGHCTHGAGAQDPHIWLSPKNAMAMATRMFQTLEENGRADFERYNALILTLEKLDAKIAAQLEPYGGHRFYVFHPSFGYFADAYGLHQVPIELEGKSPSPRQLAALIEQAQVDGVKVIFVQKQFPADSANVVANAIDGVVVQLDPLAEDIVANLRQIADSMVHAFKR